MSFSVVIMANSTPVEVTNPPTNMLSQMPSPHGKNSLCFRGKDIETFLMEYEHFAIHANLMDEVKCKEVRIYFSKREKRVLDILEGYQTSDWVKLKRELRLLYMSSAERRVYQPRDLQHFIMKKRKISKLNHFDTYRCLFLVITAGLEAQNALSVYDKDNYFWSGIRPKSLQDILENELRVRDYWTDLTLPPPIDRVTEVAVKFLNRAIYQPRDVSLRSKWTRSKKKRKDSSSSESESSDEMASDSSASSKGEESSDDEDNDDTEERKKAGKKKSREKNAKEPKDEERPATDQHVQTNIEDLANRFKRLELKLGERSGQQSQPPRTRAAMYCIMCGASGHGIRDCTESKFFIGQDICRMDVNNCVVMSDGTALPRAEGEGGVAKQICDRLSGNNPSVQGPMLTSASNVEVVAKEADYDDEPEELARLGSMEFEVFPADRSEKAKKAKPYDHHDAKKGMEKTAPEVFPQPKDMQPNRAYVELPPSILKHVPPESVSHPQGEDQEMTDGQGPVPSKGKMREQPMVTPAPPREPEVTSSKLREHTSALKEAPRFEVANPKSSNEKMRNQPPQYKYTTELMNGMNQEQVFQNLMDQPVMLKLGELLGTLYDLGHRFQVATHSQHFPVQQVRAANAEVSSNMINEGQDLTNIEDRGIPTKLSKGFEFSASSGEASTLHASTEELHKMFYQNMMQEEFHCQPAYPVKEVNLAHPHEYCAMVTARLNGRIGDQDYMMLVDSGSELNIMTLQQAQELALPIDDSGNSWTLKGISGHTMGLEGICWNVPVKIGGIEFSHNFFVMRSDLGNKDMV